MSTINLGTVSGHSYPTVEIKSLPEIKTPAVQEIEQQSKAQGRKEIGERAHEAALQHLAKLLHHKDIQVSTYMDTRSGLKNTVITDGETGRTIAELPPAAVIEITEKAREKHIGWIVDVMT
ncbi:MAG: hypothetical protein GT589_06870 [Peptoclostridium sp.]|uniref:flagellar protein FlaG n=1 Tax=Peptoclostridium sp. TaxID=1904860 RepID=UPI00139D14F5|nr:flagellar protein FlaG [Peptoclostridium sp.]MZQ75868.1 hypothetical protein [Peptoclostridium sp.]